MKKRPPLVPASEEMRRRSVLLAAEILQWPETRAGKMFGLQSLYRGDLIFALLPASRCLWESDSIAIKMHGAVKTEGKKAKAKNWQMVALANDNDLRVALERLDEAYQSAANPSSTGVNGTARKKKTTPSR